MSSGKPGTHEASAYDHVPVNRADPDLRPRIIIVSDIRLYREGLALSLARADRLVVVGVADTVASALTCIEEKIQMSPFSILRCTTRSRYHTR